MTCAVLDMPNQTDQLIIKYQKYVHSIAKKLISSHGLPAENLDEMISAGYLGLVEAAGRYDSKSLSDFKSYAFLRIRGAIIDSIRASSELRGRAYKISRAWQAIQDLEETFCSESENQDRPEKLLANILEFAASGALAFKFSLHDYEEEVSEALSRHVCHEEKFVLRQENCRLKNLVDKLPEKERFIIEAYYYEEKSFSEIALQLGGHSKGWVSRLHIKALSRLKCLLIDQRRKERV